MSKIPEFKSIAEERMFWETHSTTEFLDDMEAVQLEFVPSPRCSVCQKVLASRYISLTVADGRVTLHRIRQLYCPRGHDGETRLAPESERLVRAIEAVVALEPAPSYVEAALEKVAA